MLSPRWRKVLSDLTSNKTRTIQNLKIVRIDAERQLLLVSGSVPGSAGRDVIVKRAVKG